VAGNWRNRGLNVIAWGEFLCGPVTPEQTLLASAAFPDPVMLTPQDAARAAELFNATGRRRGSLADCLIAATCLRLGASIATNNLNDFQRFMPMGLRIVPAT
jgi:predicted nucleic acid-binding protein